MFWLAVIGIMVAGSMSAGSMPLKGWIAGWLGMLLALIGLDSIHAVPRFTFGSFALHDGISYVAVLIGLFGLAEIFRTLPSHSAPTIPSEVGKIVPPLGLLMRFSPSAIRSGIMGTLIGAIPGAGANVASFLAYDIAWHSRQRCSRCPARSPYAQKRQCRPDHRDRPTGPDLLHLRRADHRKYSHVYGCIRTDRALREAL
jgi:TctA family transporter